MNIDHGLQQFVERMGLFFESEGLPRIAGRLYAHLLLQDDPCSLDELTTDLQVSKTSISSNARLLEQHGLLQLVARPGDRRDYYAAASDASRMIEMRLNGVRAFNQILAEALQALAADHTSGRTRLSRMVEVNAEFVSLLTEMLARRRG